MSGRLRRWEPLALAGLALPAFAGFVLYPTYPNDDSLYSLLWGGRSSATASTTTCHGQRQNAPATTGSRT
jgi:hypothetical protein